MSCAIGTGLFMAPGPGFASEPPAIGAGFFKLESVGEDLLCDYIKRVGVVVSLGWGNGTEFHRLENMRIIVTAFDTVLMLRYDHEPFDPRGLSLEVYDLRDCDAMFGGFGEPRMARIQLQSGRWVG